jgi:hypothetical protein
MQFVSVVVLLCCVTTSFAKWIPCPRLKITAEDCSSPLYFKATFGEMSNTQDVGGPVSAPHSIRLLTGSGGLGFFTQYASIFASEGEEVCLPANVLTPWQETASLAREKVCPARVGSVPQFSCEQGEMAVDHIPEGKNHMYVRLLPQADCSVAPCSFEVHMCTQAESCKLERLEGDALDDLYCSAAHAALAPSLTLLLLLALSQL